MDEVAENKHVVQYVVEREEKNENILLVRNELKCNGTFPMI